jgi:FAD/FMN-containing dehydrogenase
MLGEHSISGDLSVHQPSKLSIPFNLPSFCLNKFSVQAFNTLYYHRNRCRQSVSTQHYDPYFYPLDGVSHWNRLYGKSGFTQYQCVLPKSAGLAGLTEILCEVSAAGQGSFLAVLKALGPQNQNLLSFPMQGYTLALDFKVNSQVFALLNKLDIIVQRYGGRLYLTKDARMSEAMFKSTYPNWEAFQEVRERYGAAALYNSLQSKRIGL